MRLWVRLIVWAIDRLPAEDKVALNRALRDLVETGRRYNG